MMDRDWRSWWNAVPTSFPETEFHRQVGRTEGGRPTDERDVLASASAVVEALGLTGEQTVVDLCCGNGMVTRLVAPYCRKLIGIDYSASLLAVARRHHSTSNIVYIECSVLDITPSIFKGTVVDRAFMCFSTQYFDAAALQCLLRELTEITTPGFRLFLDDIPDETRLTAFYNTPERWQEYQRRKADGTEAIGEWWRRERLVEVAAEEGYECRLIEQEPSRRRSHYRFDALLKR